MYVHMHTYTLTHVHTHTHTHTHRSGIGKQIPQENSNSCHKTSTIHPIIQTPPTHPTNHTHFIPLPHIIAGNKVTCISGLEFQSESWMQSGFNLIRRLHKNTPSRSDLAKSTKSTSGFVTRCVGGITPLTISHCLA